MLRTSSALEPLLREIGLEGASRLGLVRRRWGRLMGRSVALHSFPSSLKDGRLLVNVDSPAWLQQLSFHKEGILDKLSDAGVRDVRFRLGRVPQRAAKQTEDAATHEKAGPSGNDLAHIDAVLSEVKDAELRESIGAAMKSWASRKRGYGTGGAG